MPFSERTKLEAKRRSAFRCCVCQHIFVEVHHIIPQEEDGPDTIDNAAPLCSRCHDLFGDNPKKRKQLREMRDYWWELMAERASLLTTDDDLNELAVVTTDPRPEGKLSSKVVALYHCVYAHERFEVAAKAIWELIVEAQKSFPGKPRHLYLDIEGHKNKKGGFDDDMWELQRHFILGALARHLKRMYLPLIAVQRNKAQRNDLPQEIRIMDSEKLEEAIANLDEGEIYVGDADRWIKIDSSINH